MSFLVLMNLLDVVENIVDFDSGVLQMYNDYNQLNRNMSNGCGLDHTSTFAQIVGYYKKIPDSTLEFCHFEYSLHKQNHSLYHVQTNSL